MVATMNSTKTSSSCKYNETSCYYIDNERNCLSDDTVLDLILKYVIPTYYEWICIILYVIVFIVGTVGNLLVIIVIQRNRSMRYNYNIIWSLFILLYIIYFFYFRTVTNMFIMNLAAADLLVLVFCLPATVIQDVTKTWFFGLILCKFVNYIQVSYI
jgi:hypocretin (orexin) receptor 2